MLTFRAFSQINRRRSESPSGFNHSLNSWSLSDWMTATMGELGEAANIAKKLNRVRDNIPGNAEKANELRAALRQEFADVFCYLDLMVQSQGLKLEEIVPEKFNEVSRRMGCPIEFSSDDAEPVTYDWLKSVGFLKDGGDEDGFPLALTLCYGRTEYKLNNGLGEGRQLIIDATGDTAIEEYDEGGLILASVSTPTCKTRGQLRRLCSALDIELKERSNAPR